VIEVSLTDRDADRCQRMELTVNGRVALVWVLEDEVIVEPAPYAGRTLFGGYGLWGRECFPDEAVDLWRIAQMAVFVARGRAYIVDGPVPHSVTEEPERKAARSFWLTPISRDNQPGHDHASSKPA
jgi:hypothetical protein